MNALTVLNVLSLFVIVGVAGDALRRMRGHHQPLRALAFCAVAVGAFGEACFALRQGLPSGWCVLFHVGCALCATLHHRTDIRRYISGPGRIH